MKGTDGGTLSECDTGDNAVSCGTSVSRFQHLAENSGQYIERVLHQSRGI